MHKKLGARLKIISAVVIVMIITSFTWASQVLAFSTSISISPAVLEVASESTFTIDILIDTAVAIRGWQLDVFFDATKLQCASVTRGGFLQEWADNHDASAIGLGAQLNNTTGMITGINSAIVGAESDGGPEGSGILCTLTFTAQPDAEGIYRIIPLNARLCDVNASYITDITTSACAVNIAEQGKTPPPTTDESELTLVTQPLTSELTLSEPPVLGKEVNLGYSFSLLKEYSHDIDDAFASLKIPAAAFKVSFSGDVISREETVTDHAFNNTPDTRYIILEWHGKMVRGQTYSMEVTLESVQTGYWGFEGMISGSSLSEVDGDNIYVGIYKDTAEISDLPLPLPADGMPMIDVEHTDEPPIIIPWDETPRGPGGALSDSRSNTTTSGQAKSFDNPLMIKGKFVCYISRNVAGEKHLDTSTPMPLIWGKYYVFSQYNTLLGEGLTCRGSGGAYGTNNGEFSITIENPYPQFFYVMITPMSDMVEVCDWLSYYDTAYYQNAIPTTQTEVDIGTNNPALAGQQLVPLKVGAWRVYESLANDIYDRGAYYYLCNSPRGPRYTDMPVVTVYYPRDITGPFGEPPYYDAYVTHAIYLNEDWETRALDIVQHEYAHRVMHKILYHDAIGSPIQPANHNMELVSSATLAWTEGWANFFPLAVQNDCVFNYGGYTSSWNLETITWGTPGWDEGDQVEGRVAGALWDLYDNTNDGTDVYSCGFLPIWNCFNAYQPQTETFHDFWNIFNKTITDNDAVLAEQALHQNTIDYVVVRTISAINVTATSATIRGSLSSLGSASSVYVFLQWGTTTGYGNTTTITEVFAPLTFSQFLTGLSPNTTYPFKAFAAGDDYGWGRDFTFTTLAQENPTVGMRIEPLNKQELLPDCFQGQWYDVPNITKKTDRTQQDHEDNLLEDVK